MGLRPHSFVALQESRHPVPKPIPKYYRSASIHGAPLGQDVSFRGQADGEPTSKFRSN
jgi:hypothetical protein